MLIIFQIRMFALLLLSFLLVIGVPVIFASPEDWLQNKNLVLSGTGIWFSLILVVGILSSFVTLASINTNS